MRIDTAVNIVELGGKTCCTLAFYSMYLYRVKNLYCSLQKRLARPTPQDIQRDKAGFGDGAELGELASFVAPFHGIIFLVGGELDDIVKRSHLGCGKKVGASSLAVLQDSSGLWSSNVIHICHCIRGILNRKAAADGW